MDNFFKIASFIIELLGLMFEIYQIFSQKKK